VIDSSLLFFYRKFLTWDWFFLPFRHVDIVGVKIAEPSSRIIHLTKKLASKGKNQKKKSKRRQCFGPKASSSRIIFIRIF
jgi:hypothetical protein